MPSGVFEDESCAIFIFKSSSVGCGVAGCACARTVGKYCSALNEPEKHRAAIVRIITVLMIFRILLVIRW